jgi:hypothetical protein
MKKQHGGTNHVQGVLNRGPRPQPATTSGGFNGGTMHVKGRVHATPTRPMVNSANYAGHKVKRK